VTDIDYATVAESLKRLLTAIDAGDLTATTATRYRIEGAILAFSAVAKGEVPSAADLLAWTGLQDTND